MTMKSIPGGGEKGLLARLTPLLSLRSDVIAGIGDDCAVVRPSSRSDWDWLLTSDPVIEAIHFVPGTDPAAVGHKAVGRVLSDIAAMGGEPLWLLIDLVIPPRRKMSVVETIYRGAEALASRYGAAIIGGDMAKGPVLELHVFGVGRVPRGQAVLRSGAKRNDALFVTGTMGGSRAGRHLHFEPRLKEGQWLGRGRWATSMMDISDGLAADLPRLVEAGGVGAEIFLDTMPCSPALAGIKNPQQRLTHALNDGEDFELLFTVSRRQVESFNTAWAAAMSTPCTCIGTMSAPKGRVVTVDSKGRRRILSGGGYDHFR